VNIFEAINRVDTTSLVLSTGQKPESRKDLLVVGRLYRNDFHNSLLDVSANRDAFISDDAVILPGDGGRIGVAYYDTETFLNTTHRIAEGIAIDPIGKQWSAGPWLPETFASDIDSSIEIKVGTYLDKKEANVFSVYPEELRAGIIGRSQAEIAIKSAMLSGEMDDLTRKFTEAELCLAALRLVYAQYRIYFRGIKYEPFTRLELPASVASYTAKLVDGANPNDIDLSLIYV